jgi:hypothetical protein
MISYHGSRGARTGDTLVFLNDSDAPDDSESAVRTLRRRGDLADHSDGFEWGYAGSGPAQLALALLAHHTQDDARAVALHQRFKREVVAHFPRSGWNLNATEIDAWLTKQR